MTPWAGFHPQCLESWATTGWHLLFYTLIYNFTDVLQWFCAVESLVRGFSESLYFSLQNLSGWWMGRVCVQADWRWRLTSSSSRGPQCVKMTLTCRMLRWSVGSLAVGLLQSSRGRSMETWRLQCGPKSSSVEAMSLLSWTVTAQTQIETPAHLEKLSGLTCSGRRGASALILLM